MRAIAFLVLCGSTLVIGCGDSSTDSPGGGGQGGQGGEGGEGGDPAQGGEGGGGGSNELTCPDAPPDEGTACTGEGSCTFSGVYDACGNDEEPVYECTDGAWAFLGANAVACELECPAEMPESGAACDPAVDGTHCEYVEDDGPWIMECLADETWGVASGPEDV
ncbi:MAG: hypothetical protein HOW73_31460 [Polyangiaceae bacterium]|nr:hypothetical protein [Polyangiaceae bacterium]